MVENITKFLLELGKGFAYVGRQYHLEVGGEDFYIDLLFYHLKLRSYIVIELKTGKFKPEYTLRDNSKPIGVSEYKLSLPAELAKELPTVEQLTKLGKNIENFNKYDNQILEFLKKAKTATTKELSKFLNLSDRRVREILKDMQNKNLIKKI